MFNKSKKIEIKAEEVLWNKNIRLHNRKSDMNKKIFSDMIVPLYKKNQLP